MQLQLKELVTARDAIKELNEIKGLKGSVAYKIAKNHKLVESELEPYTKTEQEIIQRYALKDENGEYRSSKDGQYLFNVEDVETIQEELGTIQEEEVDIDVRKISFNELEKAGLSGKQIQSLEFMLDFDDELTN